MRLLINPHWRTVFPEIFSLSFLLLFPLLFSSSFSMFFFSPGRYLSLLLPLSFPLHPLYLFFVIFFLPFRLSFFLSFSISLLFYLFLFRSLALFLFLVLSFFLFLFPSLSLSFFLLSRPFSLFTPLQKPWRWKSNNMNHHVEPHSLQVHPGERHHIFNVDFSCGSHLSWIMFYLNLWSYSMRGTTLENSTLETG